MANPTFAYGDYAVQARSNAMVGERWQAEYRLLHDGSAATDWAGTAVTAGFDTEPSALDFAHALGVTEIEAAVARRRPAPSKAR
jgi:hypothetical protein